MSDPTYDFLASGGGSSAQKAAPSSGDPTLDFLSSGGGEPQKESAPVPRGTMIRGALETGAHYLSSAAALPFEAGASLYQLATSPKGLRAGNAANASQSVGQALTYQPRTQEGQAMTATADTIMGLPGRLGDAAAQAIAGPNGEGNEGLAAGADVAIQAVPALLGVRGVRAIPGQVGRAVGAAGEQVASAPRGWGQPGSLSDSPQSMGAAKTSPMANLSPGLQEAVRQAAQKTGGAISPDTLARHQEADSLPVKVQLTPGQATQDPAMLSHEMNNRGKIAGLPERLNEQNKQLGQNIQAIRDRVGPDVFSTNPVEHGDTLIQAYKDKAAPVEADITAKYQALKDANGGQFPVDVNALRDNASAALHKELLFDHAPKAIMSTLGRLADDGKMTFENFESLRTNLARIQRSATADGNEKAAAGVIRNSMEQLPLSPGAAALKPLADAARGAARAQFAAVDADPAYKAALNGEVPPDRFVQKFVTGAPRDQVAMMRDNLKDNDTATQTMGVATLDHLRQAAGIDDQGNGNFSQAGFNKQWQALSPKRSALVDPQTAEQLDTLGNVARYTQAQPRGSFVNNSNTLVGALASHAAGAAEGIANVKAGGIPVGTFARKALQNRTAAKSAKETLAPYGGLTKLSDVAKP